MKPYFEEKKYCLQVLSYAAFIVTCFVQLSKAIKQNMSPNSQYFDSPFCLVFSLVNLWQNPTISKLPIEKYLQHNNLFVAEV